MVLWALSELRYDALACLEALAEVGLKVLKDPAERRKLMAQEVSMLLLVRPPCCPCWHGISCTLARQASLKVWFISAE